MYISSEVVKKIKIIAKQKNISIKDLLNNCELNKNTLSTMTSRGSWIQADSLAKIADVLNCSVDYLLGRTDIPEINKGITVIDGKKSSNAQFAAYSGSDISTSFTVDEEIRLGRLLEKKK